MTENGDLQQVSEAGEQAPSLVVRSDRLRQLAETQRVLLSSRSISRVVKYLLEDLPDAYGALRGELRLHDPEGTVAQLLSIHRLFGDALSLEKDSEALHQLYPEGPAVAFTAYDDERMFALLPGVESVSSAIMLPLLDGNRLLGSFHLGFGDGAEVLVPGEEPLWAMLAQLVASTLVQVFQHESSEKMTLVDPVTEVANLRAFRRDLYREISWARRTEDPLSLLYIGIDDLADLCSTYGDVACNFLQRRLSQRLCAELRATDYIAHLSTTQFAMLLPACSEPYAHDIAERMRRAIEQLAMDNGRGAVLYVTLSVGLVSWEPARHPVDSDERLAKQLESEAQAAMQGAERAGGNQVSVARLGLLML
jgi:diguanylate cyclase (GGDEF)-like protein